ncbi:MAG: MFS transporter [Nitrososphaeria archaeon]
MKAGNKQKTRSANSTLAIVTVSHMMQHIFLGTSVLFPLIISELKLSYAEFGLAVALSTFIGGLFQLVPSIISRRVARHVILGVGNILLSVGTFLTGISHGILDFLGARTLSNVGTSPTHPMGTAIISGKFEDEKIGWAIGIHYGLAYIGNIIGPLLMTFLAVAFNWRVSLFVFSVPCLIVGITMIWYLSEGKKMTYGKESNTTSLKSDVVGILKTKGVLSLLLAQILFAGAIDINLLTTYTPIFLTSVLKLNTVGSGIFYTIELSGGIFGPLILGRIGAKRGYIKTAVFSTTAAVTSVVLLSFYSSANLVLAVHLFLLGFFCFSFTTLAQSHLIQITAKSSRDLAVGIYFTCLFSAYSLWVAIMGYMIDIYSSFLPAFILMGVLGATGIIVLVAQVKNTGPKPNVE